MTNATSTKDPDKYEHALYFGYDWTEEIEQLAEDAESVLCGVYLPTGDTMISTEEGQPVKLLFWTADKIKEFDQGRIVQACGPQSYTFNAEDL